MKLLVCLLASFGILVSSFSAPPNVILIMVDDFGYECITANGGESYQTPNIDKLAATGVRFENCHVQPLCTPTRVQLMTGRYNVRNYINFGTLLRTETTFGNLMKNAGYATGICGKWQLGARWTRRSTLALRSPACGSRRAARRATRTPAWSTTAWRKTSRRGSTAPRW